MTKPDTAVPEYVHKANEKKLKAEARAARAEARSKNLEAASQELSLELQQVQTEAVLRAAEFDNASDHHRRIYRFAGEVTGASASKCMDTLTRWSRLEPGCDIEIVFFSPGGSVTDGLALFDTILQLRRAGHKVTTTCIGMAASMAGILLQAGDVRKMSRESWVLIHEVSASAMGSMGEIQDRVEWLKRIQERILDIFAERAAGSRAKKPMSRHELSEKWRRTDFWLSSEDCLKHGFVDEII